MEPIVFELRDIDADVLVADIVEQRRPAVFERRIAEAFRSSWRRHAHR